MPNTHSVDPNKPVQGTTPKSNTNGWNTHRRTKTTRAATYTGTNRSSAPAHVKAPASTATCAQSRATPSFPPPPPQCTQQHPAHPRLRTRTRCGRHAWPTTRHSARKRPRPRRHDKTATLVPAPNNPPCAPDPPRSDQHLARKAPPHLRLRADRPWPRAGPQRGAENRPKIGVTKYVPRQLGDMEPVSN